MDNNYYTYQGKYWLMINEEKLINQKENISLKDTLDYIDVVKDIDYDKSKNTSKYNRILKRDELIEVNTETVGEVNEYINKIRLKLNKI